MKRCETQAGFPPLASGKPCRMATSFAVIGSPACTAPSLKSDMVTLFLKYARRPASFSPKVGRSGKGGIAYLENKVAHTARDICEASA